MGLPHFFLVGKLIKENLAENEIYCKFDELFQISVVWIAERQHFGPVVDMVLSVKWPIEVFPEGTSAKFQQI